MLETGAAVNVKDKRGQTALMRAAMANDYKDRTQIVDTLIAAKANIDDVDDSGQTALMFAIQSSRPWRLESVRFLLKSGANVNIKDNEDITPLELARRLGESEMVKLLEEAQTRR